MREGIVSRGVPGDARVGKRDYRAGFKLPLYADAKNFPRALSHFHNLPSVRMSFSEIKFMTKVREKTHMHTVLVSHNIEFFFFSPCLTFFE